MSDDQQPAIAEITREAHARCLAIGGGALDAVEALRAELEKNPLSVDERKAPSGA